MRYWFFIIISYLFGLVLFSYYSVLHAFFSSFSASMGIVNPRYLVSVFGLSYLSFFTVGIVFLSFDVRARDQRDRIVDVMDCRPLTNFELIAGRALGIFLVSWIPLVVLCLLLQGLGTLLPLLGSPVGATVEPYSLFGFAVYMAIPTIVFSISLVFFITLLLKHRLLAALVSLAILGGLFWGTLTLPLDLIPLLDFMGLSNIHFPSDITSAVAVDGGWIQRLGFLTIGLSLLGFATLIHPRLDGGNKKHTLITSTAIIVFGLTATFITSQMNANLSALKNDWLSAHQAKSSDSIPDIISIEGKVQIDPGKEIQAQLTLQIQAPENDSLSHALFTLNPGFNIEQISSENGNELIAIYANGLLEIELDTPLLPGQNTTIQLHYSGKPNVEFGYLDTYHTPDNIISSNDQAILGYQIAYFDKRFVSLMPGNYWMPLAGVDVGRDDTRNRAKDFFSVELELEMPDSWLAAGPGQRFEISQDEQQQTITYRFSPDAQLSEVAVIASEFERFQSQINDINFEILVHPDHIQNFEVLAPIQTQVEQWVSDRLDLAKDAGLNYAFDTFTLVEVPNSLRAFKGGWRMDTAMGPPSMLLLRESGFPTSRFDFNFEFSPSFVGDTGQVNTSVSLDSENFTNVNLDRIYNFFANDMSGGNLFSAMARSFFSNQTTAIGEEAIALDFMLENLANLVVSDSRSFFSVYSNINTVVESIINGGATNIPGSTQTISSQTIDRLTSDIDLWNSSINTSLVTIDPTIDPEQTINLLTLKAGNLAQAIFDSLGPQASGQLLAALLSEHQNGSYSFSDFLQQLSKFDNNLSDLVEEVMTGTQLPGFIVENVDLFRLPNGDGGESRYQLIVAIRNDETVAGFTRMYWAMPGDDFQINRSEVFRVGAQSALEFGVVLSEPPLRTGLEPYLSLNRNSFIAKIFSTTLDIPEQDLPAFNGTRPVVWNSTNERIILDDLDATFSTTPAPGEEDNRSYDQGIPLNTGNAPIVWNRIPSASSYGKYRHTFASIVAGIGDNSATLTTNIPYAGLWDLEFFMPGVPPNREEGVRGVWKYQIVSDYGIEEVDFDNTNAVNGWNLIGPYQLPEGEVTIIVSDETTAGSVIIDAFAWSPVNANSVLTDQLEN